jgi:hypothetical protein
LGDRFIEPQKELEEEIHGPRDACKRCGTRGQRLWLKCPRCGKRFWGRRTKGPLDAPVNWLGAEAWPDETGANTLSGMSSPERWKLPREVWIHIVTSGVLTLLSILIVVLMWTEAISGPGVWALPILNAVLITIHLVWGRRVMRRNRPG